MTNDNNLGSKTFSNADFDRAEYAFKAYVKSGGTDVDFNGSDRATRRAWVNAADVASKRRSDAGREFYFEFMHGIDARNYDVFRNLSPETKSHWEAAAGAAREYDDALGFNDTQERMELRASLIKIFDTLEGAYDWAPEYQGVSSRALLEKASVVMQATFDGLGLGKVPSRWRNGELPVKAI